MKNFIFFFLIHIVIPITLISPLHSSPTNLINITCKNTPHMIKLCTSIATSNPKNLETLAALIIDLAVKNATGTLSFIRDLIEETTDPAMERALVYCAEVYLPIVKYTLPQGMVAFKNGQFGFTKYSLSYAAKKVGTCEKMVSGEMGSALGYRNKMFCEMCDVGVAIINTLC